MSDAYFSVSGTKAGWLAALEESRKAQLLNDAAPMLLEAATAMMPRGICTTNRNIPDDMEVPLLTTMGELRRLAAALAKARGEA